MKHLTRRTILAAAPGALAFAAPVPGRAAGPRREGLRPGRHRHRDQDRQHRPLQRPGLVLQRGPQIAGRLFGR